jgi:hypothetical protein
LAEGDESAVPEEDQVEGQDFVLVPLKCIHPYLWPKECDLKTDKERRDAAVIHY